MVIGLETLTKNHSFEMVIFQNRFIHEEKTKEITTIKKVWMCDPNYHKIP